MNKLLSEEAITWINNTLLVMKSTIMKHNAEVAQSLKRFVTYVSQHTFSVAEWLYSLAQWRIKGSFSGW